MDLGLKCLAWGPAHGFACNGPDICVLSFGFHRGFHHCFKSLLALMGGGESLQNTIIGEVTAKTFNKMRVEAINEYLEILTGRGSWSINGQEAPKICV
jgi:hypothetical protein